MTRKIIYPIEFHTSHPYNANSESLANQGEAFIKEHNLKILSDGWIKAGWHPHYGDNINVLWWRADSEETAIHFKLVWNQKE